MKLEKLFTLRYCPTISCLWWSAGCLYFRQHAHHYSCRHWHHPLPLTISAITWRITVDSHKSELLTETRDFGRMRTEAVVYYICFFVPSATAILGEHIIETFLTVGLKTEMGTKSWTTNSREMIWEEHFKRINRQENYCQQEFELEKY